MPDKAEDADRLMPVKDGNAAMCDLNPRTFAWNFDDFYKTAGKLCSQSVR